MIDITKKYKTRDGREVRLYATDGDVSCPVHGAIMQAWGWFPTGWAADGRSSEASETIDDLIEVKPERWHPILGYSANKLCVHVISSIHYPTREQAMRHLAIAVDGVQVIDAWKDPRP